MTVRGYTMTADGALVGAADPLGMVDASRADTLEQAVLVSLYTDRRANDDDELPDPASDRGGWWADAVAAVDGDRIGSRLWLLRRSKPTNEVIARARAYALEALQWLVDQGIAARVEVEVERYGARGIALSVTVARASGGTLALRFSELWGG